MNLLRFALIVLAVWLIWRIARHLLSHPRPARRIKQAPVEAMVRCAHCGVHLPEHEALREGEDYYCSTRHRLGGKR